VIKRSSADQDVYAIHNISEHKYMIKSSDLSLNENESWHDLLGSQLDIEKPIELNRHQILWLSNK